MVSVMRLCIAFTMVDERGTSTLPCR